MKKFYRRPVMARNIIINRPMVEPDDADGRWCC